MITKKMKVTGSALAITVMALTGAAACTSASTVKPSGNTAPAPTVTKTVPGPTETQTVSPPPPAAGTVIATFSGSGNENTKSFTVPESGNYIVKWSYSGNTSDGMADNFIIEATGPNSFATGLPNDIAASGHGSTQVTGDSGTESFNVQADASCNWTITVVSAP